MGGIVSGITNAVGGLVNGVTNTVGSIFGGTPAPSVAAAPDYTGAANATAAGNLANLNAQTAANRVNQYTPWGNQTWSQNSNGQWSQLTSLTPAEQKALTSQQTIQQNQSNLAQNLQGQVNQTMLGGFSAPWMSSYLGGVSPVNQSFSNFNSYGLGQANTNAGSFNGAGIGQANANAGGFNSGGYGQANTNAGNFNSGAYGQANANAGNFNTGAYGQANSNAGGFNSSMDQANANFGQFNSGAGSVDPNAPKFSDANAQAGAQAAYKAQTDLLQPQMQQDTTHLDNQLRLQGLTPGTEAYNTAAQNLSRTQGQVLSQAANQAVLTGNNMANANYASQLAGYNSGNAAQQQNYNQALTGFDANQAALQNSNSAMGQNYNQALAGYGANLQGIQTNNAAQQQNYTQALAGYDANLQGMQANNAAQLQNYNQALTGYDANLQGLQASNAAQQQNYNQGLTGYGANLQGIQSNNAAIGQNYTQALAGYGANLQGIQSNNAAQQQNYAQSLAGYGANQSAIQNANAAQNQAYSQGMNNYNTAYSSALQNYLQPLNSMNAVLSGQQVQNPTMPTYNQAGVTAGSNLSGAASALGQWNSGVAAQQGANQSSMNSLFGTGLGALGTMGSTTAGQTALASLFSDIRLKKNIKKINVTEGGHNWYSWDWKDGSGSSTGVLAQEILQTVPNAVTEAANGYLMVHYGLLA
jgi:hypothetical protein